jgi:hypothetical protein
MLVLQNCMDLLQAEPGSCTMTCLMSSHDENQATGIKIKEDTCVSGGVSCAKNISGNSVNLGCMLLCVHY